MRRNRKEEIDGDTKYIRCLNFARGRYKCDKWKERLGILIALVFTRQKKKAVRVKLAWQSVKFGLRSRVNNKRQSMVKHVTHRG